MDDSEWNNHVSSGVITCFQCKESVNYEHGNTTSFFEHLKVEHNSLFHQNVLLAINFLDKTAIDCIVKQFEDSCRDKEPNDMENDDSGISETSVQVEPSEEMSFVDLLNYISDETPVEETNKEKDLFACMYCSKTFTNKKSHYNHTYQHTKKRQSLSVSLPNSKKIKSGSKIKPNAKQVKSSSQVDSQAQDPKNIEIMIKTSKYFQANPKQISTKCNLQLHEGNKFPRIDPDLPSGWKVRKHKNSTGQIENHFLSPDGRVMKSKEAVQEYMKLVQIYSKEEIQKEQGAPKLNIKTEILENDPVAESNSLANPKRSDIKLKIKKEKYYKNHGITKINGIVNKAAKNKQKQSKINKKDGINLNPIIIKKEGVESEDIAEQKNGTSTFKIKKEKILFSGKNTKITIKKEILGNKIKKKMCSLKIKKEVLESVQEDEGLSKNAKSKIKRLSQNAKSKMKLIKIKKEIVQSMDENTGEAPSIKVTRRNGIKFVKMTGSLSKSKPGRPKGKKKSPGQPKQDGNAGGECPICHKVRTNLKTHIADVHSTGNFPCPVCNKMFTSKNKMGSHWSRLCNPNRKTRKSI